MFSTCNGIRTVVGIDIYNNELSVVSCKETNDP